MSPRSAAGDAPPARSRLVLWNIDLTLVDVGRVTRAAYADAFRQVTSRALVRLPPMAGRTESEAFFEALALNPAATPGEANGEELLDTFTVRLADEFAARRGMLTTQGALLPGAREALVAVGRLPGMVQTVLTGSSQPNALAKLRAFGLDTLVDTSIGGYGSDPYPKGATLLNSRGRAAEKYGTDFPERATLYIADSARDVEAARVGGAKLLAVASGRSSAVELRDAGAHAVLDDLLDTEAVVAAVRALTVAG